MPKFIILIFLGPLFSNHVYANDEWEQCSILFTYSQLRADVKNSVAPQRLKELLTQENKALMESQTSDGLSDQVRTLTTCVQRIDPQIQSAKVEQCFPSFMVFPMAFVFRQQSLDEKTARSLNAPSLDDKRVDQMIKFIYAKPIPEPGKRLSSKWSGEWMRQCLGQ